MMHPVVATGAEKPASFVDSVLGDLLTLTASSLSLNDDSAVSKST